MRKNPTNAENRIWHEILRNKKFKGYKFARQKPIDFYILDFYCSELMLGVEIDGNIHNDRVEYDKERINELNSLGIKIIRYFNDQVINNLDSVYKDLEKQVEARKEDLRKVPCLSRSGGDKGDLPTGRQV